MNINYQGRGRAGKIQLNKGCKSYDIKCLAFVHKNSSKLEF